MNEDVLVYTGQGITGNNMYAYCNNNSICYGDPSGNFRIPLASKPLLPYVETERMTDSTVSLWTELYIMGFEYETYASVVTCQEVLSLHGIDTPEEKAHFFAQCAHETNFGLWLTELGDESYFANKAYGYKYRGGGYIQLTWDFHYKPFSEYIGDPEIYNQGADYVAEHYAWQAAGWFWMDKDMNNRIANGATVYDITTIVRGVSSGWEQRQAYYDRFINIVH